MASERHAVQWGLDRLVKDARFVAETRQQAEADDTAYFREHTAEYYNYAVYLAAAAGHTIYVSDKPQDVDITELTATAHTEQNLSVA